MLAALAAVFLLLPASYGEMSVNGQLAGATFAVQ